MDQYKVLTAENQRDLLKERLRGYEVSHFQSTCERELAKVQGRDQDAEVFQQDLDYLEKALEWCHNLYDALESAVEAVREVA